MNTIELLCTWAHFPVAYESSAKFIRTKIHNKVLAVYKILRNIDISFNVIQFLRLQDFPVAKSQSKILKNKHNEINTLELLCTGDIFQ